MPGCTPAHRGIDAGLPPANLGTVGRVVAFLAKSTPGGTIPVVRERSSLDMPNVRTSSSLRRMADGGRVLLAGTGSRLGTSGTIPGTSFRC